MKNKIFIKKIICILLVALNILILTSCNENDDFYKMINTQLDFQSCDFNISFNLRMDSQKINKNYKIEGYKNSDNEFKFDISYDNNTIKDFIIYTNSKLYIKIQEKYIELPFLSSDVLNNTYGKNLKKHIYNFFKCLTIDFKKEKNNSNDVVKIFFSSDNNIAISCSVNEGKKYIENNKEKIVDDLYNYLNALNLSDLIKEYKQIANQTFNKLKRFDNTKKFINSFLKTINKKIEDMTNKVYINDLINQIIAQLNEIANSAEVSKLSDILRFSVQNSFSDVDTYKDTFQITTENNANNLDVTLYLKKQENKSIDIPKDNIVSDLGNTINDIVVSYALKNNLKIK